MDRDAIEQLYADYAWAMDANNFDLLGEVFAEDATFSLEIAGMEDQIGPFEGRAAIIEFISGAVTEQTDQRRHVITNVRTEGSDVATAILSLFVTEDGELDVRSTGVYRCGLGEGGGKPQFTSMHLALDRGY